MFCGKLYDIEGCFFFTYNLLTSEWKMMTVSWAKRQKLRHGWPQYTGSCMGHSLAAKHPVKHWILVLPHTSLHTTRHAVTLMAKILISLTGCEGMEVMSVFDVHCYNSATSVASHRWHCTESRGIMQEGCLAAGTNEQKKRAWRFPRMLLSLNSIWHDKNIQKVIHHLIISQKKRCTAGHVPGFVS